MAHSPSDSRDGIMAEGTAQASPKLTLMESSDFKRVSRILAQLNREVRGAESISELAFAALLSQGHVLLEGPPGVGKTSLAKAFGKVFSGSVSRLQMTSDLLPSEIVGVLRLSPKTQELEFRQGPLFANFVLADELNRCNAKTQAALLEAMSESAVTVDGKTHALPDPFFVMATQNPLESQGVYPLAESQLDRFALHLLMGYPDRSVEQEIFKNEFDNLSTKQLPTEIESSFSLSDLNNFQIAVQSVRVEETLIKYLLLLIANTRQHPLIRGGLSIRAGLQCARLVKALAYVRGRSFVLPKDIKDAFVPAAAHRLQLHSGDQRLASKRLVVQELLDAADEPL